MAWKLTRTLGKRIDGDYIHRPHPLRRWRRILTWGAGAACVGWFAFAGVRFDTDRPRLVGTLYNPGSVTEAHAYFEHECALCHTGDGGGLFGRGVTDAACLVCHDGAIHHANQKVANSRNEASRTNLTMALNDPNHPAGATSAACATCHVEHRGHVALAATSDAHCIVCHQDLSRASLKPPAAQAAITAFDPEHHPKFGRRLRKDGKLFDPTVLKFNHLAHKEKDLEKKLTGNNGQLICSLCHSTQQPDSLTLIERGNQPPYVTAKDRPLSAANSGERRYMQPIQFDRHCASCHQEELRLPQTIGKIRVGRRDANITERIGGDLLAHRELSIVRDQIASRLSALANKIEFTAGSNRIPRQQWVRENLKQFAAQIESRLEDATIGKYQGMTLEIPGDQGATTQPSLDATEAASQGAALLLDYYVAAVAFTGCAKCHPVEGDLPSPEPKTNQRELRTVPTGIPASPRRWFTASVFNHDAHRTWSCVECHAGALTSTLTSDVLLPDMDTRGSSGSCADCHDPNPRHQPRVAPATCATCHLYHDRTRERPPDGLATPSASR